MPHWNWKEKEGENVTIFVYTNGDSAELFINGKSQGKQTKKPTSENSVERFRLMWNDVIYESGEVKIIAFKDGKSIGEKVIKTAGKPHKIKLTPDRTILKANGSDLSYILVEAYDKKGNLCPLADNKIEITIKGNTHIAGVGNGNPQSFEPFKSNFVKLFYGKAMIILGYDFDKGKAKITAKGDNLKNSSVEIIIE